MRRQFAPVRLRRGVQWCPKFGGANFKALRRIPEYLGAMAGGRVGSLQAFKCVYGFVIIGAGCSPARKRFSQRCRRAHTVGYRLGLGAIAGGN